MRIIVLLGTLSTVLFAAFLLLNGQAMTAPSPLNLGIATVQGPPGIIAAALAAGAIIAFAMCLGMQAIRSGRARRSQAKALEHQRALAEEAETSRYNQLRIAMTSEFERLASTLSTSQDALRIEIQDSGNSIAAMLAEIDDRMRARPPEGTGTL
jgi:hypothetical protein